jgi:hypothetical protein
MKKGFYLCNRIAKNIIISIRDNLSEMFIVCSSNHLLLEEHTHSNMYLFLYIIAYRCCFLHNEKNVSPEKRRKKHLKKCSICHKNRRDKVMHTSHLGICITVDGHTTLWNEIRFPLHLILTKIRPVGIVTGEPKRTVFSIFFLFFHNLHDCED